VPPDSLTRATPHLSTLMLLTGLAVTATNLFLPSLPQIATDFETSYSHASLAIAAYFGVAALLQLILGPLSDRYGRRPVILASLAVFIIASIGCALANTIEFFLAARVLQGSVTAGFALTIVIVRDSYRAEDAATRISQITMVMAIAPMVSPAVGGLLYELFNWRACFWFLAAIGLVVYAVCYFDLAETNARKSANFTEQFRQYPQLIADPLFWALAMCAAFSVAAFHSFLVATPLVATAELGLSPALLGMCMGSITGGFMLGSFLSGRLARRLGLQRMILTGRIVGFSGTVIGLLLVLADAINVFTLFGSTLLVGIGNGLTLPSCNTRIASVNPKLSGSAMGLAAATGMGVGGLVSWITGAVVPGENSAIAMLGLMMVCTTIGLVSALLAGRSVRGN